MERLRPLASKVRRGERRAHRRAAHDRPHAQRGRRFRLCPASNPARRLAGWPPLDDGRSRGVARAKPSRSRRCAVSILKKLLGSPACSRRSTSRTFRCREKSRSIRGSSAITPTCTQPSPTSRISHERSSTIRVNAIDQPLKAIFLESLAWTRLEPQAISGDPEPGLEARMHDPLWLLARQWQLAEFEGEDVGTPLIVHVQTTELPITAWQPGDPASDRPGATDRFRGSARSAGGKRTARQRPRSAPARGSGCVSCRVARGRGIRRPEGFAQGLSFTRREWPGAGIAKFSTHRPPNTGWPGRSRTAGSGRSSLAQRRECQGTGSGRALARLVSR